MRERNIVPDRVPKNELSNRCFSNAKRRFEAVTCALALTAAAGFAKAEDNPGAANPQKDASSEAQQKQNPFPAKPHRVEVERYSPGPIRMLETDNIRVEQSRGTVSYDHYINPRALTTSAISVGGDINIPKSQRSFYNYMKKGKGYLTPKLLSIGITTGYEAFLVNERMRINSEDPRFWLEGEQAGTGDGISFSPSVVVGTGVGGIPIEVDLYYTQSFLRYELETSLTFTDGREYTVNIEDSGPYTGVSGLELRFPTKVTNSPSYHQLPVFRFERVGIGFMGETENYFMYTTGSFNYMSTTGVVLRNLTTLQFANLGSHSFAAEMIPFEAYMKSIKLEGSFGPGIKIEHAPKHDATHLEWFVEGGVGAGVVHGRLKFGGVHELTEHHYGAEPTGYFGSLNITVHTY